MGNMTRADGTVSQTNGAVFQWKDANGKIWQVEAYDSPRFGSTLHISQLETDASGNVVLQENKLGLKLAVRTVELNGQTGEWEPEALANPTSSIADQSIVKAVHIGMQTVTADQVTSVEVAAQEAGVLTTDFADYGVAPPADAGLPGDEGGDE